jgi:hypothetical protein
MPGDNYEIQKLKDEISKEFFKTDKNLKSKKKDEGENPAIQKIKNTLSDEVINEGITSDIINTIFMHRFQPKRFEQLRKINEARSMYQDTYYAEQFEMLDKHIEEIEEEIFRCTKIATMAFKYGVTGIVMAAWCKGTIHIDRIKLAYELSSMFRMDLAAETLEQGIKDPNLQIQYTGLIRELALHHSRMAGFENQKKFGKRPDIDVNIRPIQQITDQQMDRLIDTFRKDRKRIEEIGQSFDSFEEIKDNSQVVQPTQQYSSIEDIIAINKLKKQAEENQAEENDGSVFDLDNLQE